MEKRPSRVTVPARAHPIARLIFSEMKRQCVTYAELEWRSGVLLCTIKSWRWGGTPSLISAYAALGALGWSLIPIPREEGLSKAVREQLEEIGQNFVSDDRATAAMIAAAIPPQPRVGTEDEPAPLLDYGRNLVRGMRRYSANKELPA